MLCTNMFGPSDKGAEETEENIHAKTDFALRCR